MRNPIDKSKTMKEYKKNEKEKKFQKINTLVRNSRRGYGSIISF